MDIRPNDHDHPALSHDLPDHVGNVDQFPPDFHISFSEVATPVSAWAAGSYDAWPR